MRLRAFSLSRQSGRNPSACATHLLYSVHAFTWPQREQRLSSVAGTRRSGRRRIPDRPWARARRWSAFSHSRHRERQTLLPFSRRLLKSLAGLTRAHLAHFLLPSSTSGYLPARPRGADTPPGSPTPTWECYQRLGETPMHISTPKEA